MGVPFRIPCPESNRGGLCIQKETCLQNYERHIERVQQVIPPQKLLVYNWSDGWAPLTHFLHLPVPEEEFPRVDEVKIHLDVRGKIMDVLGMNG